MTLAEIKAMLDETGVYVGYGFVINRPPPYISYREAYSNNAFADNMVNVEAAHYDVELVTTKKDEALERKLKNVLNSYGIPWQKTSESVIEDDSTFSVIFEFEEVKNG